VRSAFARATLAHRDRRIATVASLSVSRPPWARSICRCSCSRRPHFLLGVAHVARTWRYLVLPAQPGSLWQSSVWLGQPGADRARVLEELGVRGAPERLDSAQQPRSRRGPVRPGCASALTQPSALALAALGSATAYALSERERRATFSCTRTTWSRFGVGERYFEPTNAG